MSDNKTTEELIKTDPKEILYLIKNACGPSTLEEHETNRQYLTGILNYKLSKITESLSRKILCLNIILVILTIILVADPIIKICRHFGK